MCLGRLDEEVGGREEKEGGEAQLNFSSGRCSEQRDAVSTGAARVELAAQH